MDRGHWDRPFRCPTWLLAFASLLAFVNMAFMGAGADVWGEGTLRNGLLATLLIIPVFWFRHYVQDKGVFPAAQVEAEFGRGVEAETKRAGWLPYLAMGGCAVLVWFLHNNAQLPKI